MEVRALFTECNEPLWVEVAAELGRLAGWRPVYWVGLDSLEDEVRQRFAGVAFHSKLAAIRGLPSPDAGHLAPMPLDQPRLTRLAPCEGVVLRLLDRMDPRGSFSLRERLDLYYRYLGYWGAVLGHYRPQAVFFPIAPHMAYDYALYVLCQERGIPTIMLEQALIASLLFPMARFEDQENLVTRAYRRLLAADQGGEIVLSPAARASLESLRGPYKRPFYVDRMGNGGAGGAGGLGQAWRRAKDAPHRLAGLGQGAWNILTRPAPLNYVKVKGRPYQGAPIGHARFEYYRWLGRRKKRQLKALYDSLARPPRLDEPYVYLPLHYQPEMSTLPTGGYFEDQRLLAGLIHACLPEGWRLYVKEHPVQVAPVGKGQYSRDFDFYRQLLALPGVGLVPLDQSSFELIDHARAVATITGQAAWEAVNRGKPALTFGHCWYRGCEGVHFIQDEGSCRRALAAIAAGQGVDDRKIWLFAQAVEQAACRGYISAIFGREYGIGREENIAAIAQALAAYWRDEIGGGGGAPREEGQA